ncbi:MAG: FadR/GntR family transcriptional regulator [Acidimicrobiia bacterium]
MLATPRPDFPAERLEGRQFIQHARSPPQSSRPSRKEYTALIHSTATDRNAGNRDSSPPERKLASRIADLIVRDISSDGWAAGRVIGSEAELLQRYDVSRAVFRESVRLLEHLGVCTTRRGPGGGLVVTAPSTAGVVQAFLVYLTYADLSLPELLEARVSLERSVARLAAERADEQQISAMRERVVADRGRAALDAAAHHVLHTMIGAAAANPAAELFVDVLGRLTARWSYPVVSVAKQNEALDASAAAHEAIVDAITAGNTALAERRMNAHLGALADWLGRNRQTPISLDRVLDDGEPDAKLGSQVARAIIVDIADRGWPMGDVLGSEAELIATYQVSRSALREAVRLLEYHEVATMRRGPGGGLVVTAPSIEPIVRAATVFLEHRGITAADLIAMRRDLESDAVALATERATTAQIADLRLTLESNADADFEGPLGEELHVRIAELSGNAAMALFVRVLVELTRLHASIPGRRSGRRSAINAETDHAHRAIVEAIARRDPALAQRRVTKHLNAIEPLLR